MKVISIEGHPHEQELIAYVSDTLEPHVVTRLEDHVFECELCAGRLQRAASFQMLLHDAASQMEAETVVPAAAPVRRRWRVGAVGGLWSAAAALVLMVCQHTGKVDVDPPGVDDTQVVAQVTEASPTVVPWSDKDTGSSELLASVDPLESVDPLQTWPEDRFEGEGWMDEEFIDGEPCGSGEDGGPLVCHPVSG